MRFFNTAGPVNPADHYCLPPFARLDRDEVLSLIDQKKYFGLHAPRQTGKTSCLLALMEELNREGRYRCLYCNIEAAQALREDVAAAMRNMVQSLAESARAFLGDDRLKAQLPHWFHNAEPTGLLEEALSYYTRLDPRPLVLLLDEVDALVGDTLIAVLRQLRAGYTRRPADFPQSVILCGIRDIRDYRIHSSADKAIVTGGSAFNVKARSLRLGEFSRADLETLYAQHTAETGQVFTAEALARAWELTEGQPWLVNALAYEVTWEMRENRDRSRTIDGAAMEQAKERLIQRRETHLDQLADKLQEERVRRVVGPLLAGVEAEEELPVDDVQYCRDLGLVAKSGMARIANPIYREIIPRQLVANTTDMLAQEGRWYLAADGRLELGKLLAAFQAFFREHSEHWVERFQYKEAGPQLLMQAFLQRVVNGGGRIEREYGLGRMRTDLLVVWPHPAGVQKAVIELKILHKGLAQTLAQGLEQTAEYLDRSGAEEGHLVIFDRTPGRPWEERLFRREEAWRGRAIGVWGM